ncbi:hypothetical protein EW145_g1785 [Phellinidium pouzarii]|uniref:Major facilitator superfamily (MFS) profile domain-containing protein n=1 Tax=Phellinidium pouzarii TaxID=167371 RepID=A0A4S4LD91_9AGAM|nr:hypothetical protein EW145_g1785 [Phellinidium pouzarii]
MATFQDIDSAASSVLGSSLISNINGSMFANLAVGGAPYLSGFSNTEIHDGAEPLPSQTYPQAIDCHTKSDIEIVHGGSTLPLDSRDLKLTDQTNLLPFRKVVSVFSGLSVCIVVSTLDMTLVATALPSISSYFHAGSVALFIPSTYLLTSTAFQPLYGRFSDIFGRKAALCLAMFVFMLGNLAAGFSKKVSEVIILRGIAGAGGGGIVSMAQIVMSDVVTLRDRGKYQGIIGVVVALGYGIGPLIGGVLSEKVSWRAYRLMYVPVYSQGGITFPWSSAIVLGTLISGCVIVALFCIWEWKGAKLPIVPMYIFKHITVTGVYITMFVNGFVFNSSLYYLPQFFQVALGYSPIRSGVFLLPVLVSQTVASFISGVLVSRTGRYRSIIYLGFGVWTIGCGLLSTINASTREALPVVYMLIAGVGAGQTLQTTTVAAQASVSRRDMSVVTAVRNFARLLGGTLSLAIGSTIINNSLRSKMTSLGLTATTISSIIDDPTSLHPALAVNSTTNSSITPKIATNVLSGYTQGFRAVFILNAVLTAFSVVVAAGMIRHKELIRKDEPEMRRRAREAYSKEVQKYSGADGNGKGIQRDIELAPKGGVAEGVE